MCVVERLVKRKGDKHDQKCIMKFLNNKKLKIKLKRVGLGEHHSSFQL